MRLIFVPFLLAPSHCRRDRNGERDGGVFAYAAQPLDNNAFLNRCYDDGTERTQRLSPL